MIRRLKKAALAVCGPLFVLAFVSGCVTSTEGRMEKNDEEAAKYNTQLGANYLQRGMLEQAREKLQKAVEQNPDLASAHAYLGVLYERIDEGKLAGKQYRAAARLKPKDPFILNTYGGYLCRTGKRREGIDSFLRAAKNPLYQTPTVALTNAGVCAVGIPDYEKADSYFRLALNADAGYREAMLQLADVSLKRDDPMQARAFVERYLGTGDASPSALIIGLDAETELGNEPAAQEYRRQLAEQFPEYVRSN
jgi:type IV pilus assembly protein PilF